MKNSLLALSLMISTAHATLGFANTKEASIFAGLKVGDSLAVKEVGQKFDITKIPRAIAPYKVLAIESDYIELKIGTMIKRIPVTSIRMLGIASMGDTH